MKIFLQTFKDIVGGVVLTYTNNVANIINKENKIHIHTVISIIIHTNDELFWNNANFHFYFELLLAK